MSVDDSGQTVFVVIDVGCHECGVPSEEVGAYLTSEEAGRAASAREAETGGQTVAQVFAFKVPEAGAGMSVDENGPAEETQGGWVHITMKSGAKVSARVTRFAREGSMFAWENFGHGELELGYLVPSEVAAVVWEQR